ncbi:MAG: Uma2 family endonuclease [Planctomycetaceae bacterium]
MATDLATRFMTADEFLELADEEGVTRELIDGVLEERPMTTRSPRHCTVMTRISMALANWLDRQTDRVGAVGCGEVRCRLATDPDLIVGIDIVYYEGPEAVRQSEEEPFFNGPPVVAVEVLSPSDTHEDVVERIHRCLSNGTKQVWIADPDLKTITIYRPNADADLFNAGQELQAEPELPGFRVRVITLFSSTAPKS